MAFVHHLTGHDYGAERQRRRWSHAAATQRATRGYGAPASLLVVDLDDLQGTASPPSRVSHSHRKTLSRDDLDFYHGLLAGADGPIQPER